MVERGGRIRLMVIPDAKKASLQPAIEANVSPNAKIATDDFPTYAAIVPSDKHVVGVHKDELWNHGTLRVTRTIDGAFSLLKRALVGSFHRLENDSIEAYLNEFCWRYDRRQMRKRCSTRCLRMSLLANHLPTKS